MGLEMSYRVFDEKYMEYDQWYIVNKTIYLDEAKCLEKTLNNIDGYILDLGIGTGVFSKVFKGYVVGIDPAYNPLKIAYNRGVDVVQGFGEKLPFRSNVFDLVVMTVTLCFLDNPDHVLKEVYRVLVRKGYIVSCIVPRDSSWGEYYLEKAGKDHPFYRYARFYTNKEHFKLLERNGFRVEEVMGTLSFKPWEEPILEEPKPGFKDLGFVCVRAVKDVVR